MSEVGFRNLEVLGFYLKKFAFLSRKYGDNETDSTSKFHALGKTSDK